MELRELKNALWRAKLALQVVVWGTSLAEPPEGRWGTHPRATKPLWLGDAKPLHAGDKNLERQRRKMGLARCNP